jgi:hypothetical protein
LKPIGPRVRIPPRKMLLTTFFLRRSSYLILVNILTDGFEIVGNVDLRLSATSRTRLTSCWHATNSSTAIPVTVADPTKADLIEKSTLTDWHRLRTHPVFRIQALPPQCVSVFMKIQYFSFANMYFVSSKSENNTTLSLDSSSKLQDRREYFYGMNGHQRNNTITFILDGTQQQHCPCNIIQLI